MPGNEMVDAPKSLRRHELRILGPVDLRDADGHEVSSILAQPKRLGLLCYLALADGRFTRRDTLLALFWPELSDEQARNNLRQSIHYLRRELGSDVLESRSDGALAVAPERLWCDASTFLELSRSGRHAAALELVRGELLPGVFISGVSPELEQWFDAERVRRRDLIAETAMVHAEVLEGTGQAVDAVRWGRWAFERVPHSEAILRRLVALLDRRGDRFGALVAYDQFARLLADEFEATPSPETVALIDAVRRRATQSDANAVAAADSTHDTSYGSRTDVEIANRRRRGALGTASQWIRTPVVAVSLVVLAVLTPAAVRWRTRAAEARPPRDAIARQFYQRGLDAKAGDDTAGARRFFLAALDEDSTLAVAAHAAVEYAHDSVSSRRLWGLAVRHAMLAPDRERLRIRLHWARTSNDPTGLSYADSLRRLDPADQASQIEVANYLLEVGDFPGSLAVIRDAIALDSTGVSTRTAPCSPCDAYGLLVAIHVTIDSIEVAERLLREWARKQPTSHLPWHSLSLVLAAQDRGDEAMRAWSRALALRPELEQAYLGRTSLLMYLGRWREVDSLLATPSGDGQPTSSRNVLWWRIISLRNQGRMHKALSLAEEYRKLGPRTDIVSLVPRGVVLLEMGRAAEARAVFDSTARGYPPGWFDLPSWKARHRTWSLTRVATAAAAMGDTRALEWLVDSIEQSGRMSAVARDRRLHHYVRANLLASRGAPGEAAQAYRRAIVSPTFGFSRINVELGRVLIASGRPGEAVAPLRAALHGGLEANNYYVTRTELHRELARAFDAAGNADSAIAHYQHVAAAWGHGDPGFRLQAEAARHRAIALLARARVTARR